MSLILTPQPTIDSTLSQATADGCDCVQYKFNGQWVRVEISKGFLRMYDKDGGEVESELNFLTDIPETVCGSFIGNLLLDHSLVYLWDCWYICNNDGESLSLSHHNLTNFTYRDRYAILANEFNKLQADSRLGKVTLVSRYHLIQNFPIKQSHDLWLQDLPHMCGLVFRNSKARVDVPVRVARRYKEVPKGLE